METRGLNTADKRLRQVMVKRVGAALRHHKARTGYVQQGAGAVSPMGDR